MLNPVWRHVRAVLVALHIVAVFAMAFPAPGGAMQRSAWKNPTVQAEFKAWTGRVNAVGWGISQPEFEDVLWEFSTGYMAARKAVLAPFDPYYRYCGTWQSWRMFVAPHMFPNRLHIDIEVDGAWKPVYIARNPAFSWRGSQLDHDRMRSALFRYSWRAYRGHYHRFATWVAVNADEDFPEATRVRVRYFERLTPSPEQVRRDQLPTGRYRNERVIDLP